MDRAAARFVGEHDVSRLCRAGARNPVRRILASRVLPGPAGPVYEVTARSFLWHQVRCMAATLEAVGRGELDEGGIDALLSGECRRNPPAAPADRLVLWEVGTPFPFAPVEPDPERAGEFLLATAQSHRARAGIADLLVPADQAGRAWTRAGTSRSIRNFGICSEVRTERAKCASSALHARVLGLEREVEREERDAEQGRRSRAWPRSPASRRAGCRTRTLSTERVTLSGYGIATMVMFPIWTGSAFGKTTS